MVPGILLSIHNEINTYVFKINNNKTFYEHNRYFHCSTVDQVT